MLQLKIQRIENLIRKLNRKAALPYGYCSHEIPGMMRYIEELILDLDDASHAFRLQRLLWEEVNSDDVYRENSSSSILEKKEKTSTRKAADPRGVFFDREV